MRHSSMRTPTKMAGRRRRLAACAALIGAIMGALLLSLA
jgi:hypothetical protein